MEKNHQDIKPSSKQFRLVKFFSAASFIVLIIFSFPFSVVISQNAKDILMTSYKNYALLVGENLNYQAFQNFAIPVLQRYGEIVLSRKEQHDMMDQVVKNATHGFNIEMVNILTPDKGIIGYSTKPELIGKEVEKTKGFKKALNGELSSGLVTTQKKYWLPGVERLGNEKRLVTYIPFIAVNPFTGDKGYIGGVFELTQDLTEQYESIIKFQYLVFGLSIVIMGLIFLALRLIVQRAESIINERARDQRELEAQLNQSERLAALGEMVAGVSHEIKNPLGIIQSTAELLGQMPDAPESQKRLSGVITEESARLNRIVIEFLDFARPQIPNLQKCHLEEIIKKNVLFLGPEFQKKNISVSDNIDSRSFVMQADQDLLHRVFLNIFINAIQSLEGGGSIDVRMEEKRGNYNIEINDTGKGIPDEVLKKVFNPFFTTKETGSGLGLPIVRNLIEGHRGSIEIVSKEKIGTSVRISLPKRI